MIVPCDLYWKPASGGIEIQDEVAVENQGLIEFVAQIVGSIVTICNEMPEARVRFAGLLRPMLERGWPT